METRSTDHRLESWKEIASYLNRDIRTVQRWEKSEGLPVHRHVHERQSSVHAFKSELDAWRAARAALPAQATNAESTASTPNRKWALPVAGIALLLVVGYTDAVGDEDYNQELSEKRSGRVVNFLQQKCGWAPYRMLTPTGMSESDPAADNTTAEGRAQNRRVAVNILVSKAVDGIQLGLNNQ